MNKLWLIIQREYLTRVKKRSFILATLLTPLAFGLFMVIVSVIFSYESDDLQRIAVLDKENILGAISDEKNLIFKFEDATLVEMKKTYVEKEYDAIMVIPPLKNLQDTRLTVFYYSDDPPGLDMRFMIENKLQKSIRKYKITALNLDAKELESLDTKVSINPEPIDESKADVSPMAAGVGAAIGGVMGFIMYMAVFIYGNMVMRSVMEEKTSRIVEVMISSVKPFQLMMGKIIGVGGVGLTQLIIWAILIPIISMVVQGIFGFDMDSSAEVSSAASQIDPDDMQAMAAQIMVEIKALNWWGIFPLFLFYFLGGYFLYASLFAAVGSAIGDDLGEGQSLTLPITIPVILALYIMMVVIKAPQSSLATWSSIFPFFSPIVMPSRLAFNPPLWEVIVSMLVLVATSLFFVWLSARIYRIGILMYGKKASFKELGKWLFYKG